MRIARALFPLFVVISLFSFNQFGLLDLLGIRGTVQVLAVVPTVIFAMLLILPRIRTVSRHALFRFLAVMLILFAVKNLEISMVWNLAFALLVGGVIVSCPKYLFENVFSILIVTLTVFSLMGILQWIILQFEPGIVRDLSVFVGVYLNNPESVIFSDDSSYGTPTFPALRLLGLATGELFEIGPLLFTRLRSFLHEPSLAVAYFVLPGALALTFCGYKRKAGFIVLLFSVLTFAGSVFLLAPLALLSFFILKLRSRKYANYLTVAIAMAFYAVVYFVVPPFDTASETGGVDFRDNLSSSVDFNDINDKTVSNLKRLGFIAYGISTALQHPVVGVMGLDLHAVLGMYLWSAVYGGIIGLTATYVLFYKLFSMLWISFNLSYAHGFARWSPFVLIFAVFIEAICFNDFGFSVGYGLTMIALTYRRLEDISIVPFERSAVSTGTSEAQNRDLQVLKENTKVEIAGRL